MPCARVTGLETEEIRENVKHNQDQRPKTTEAKGQKQHQLKRGPTTKCSKTKSDIAKMKKPTVGLPMLSNNFRSGKKNDHITEPMRPRRGRKYPDKDRRTEEQTK